MIRFLGGDHINFYALVVMHVCAMTLNSLLMAGLVDGLHLPLYLTQVVVTLFISAMIFVVSKHWVYQP